MNKIIIAIIAIIIVAGAIFLGLRFLTPEDTWLCQNGQWIKHGNPSSPMPTDGCGTPAPEQEITMISPQPNQVVTSPLIIEGTSKGGWFFEGSFPIKILDASGQEIASSFVQAQSDWMTTDPVNFRGEIRFISPASGNGTLLLQKDNPSGLPQNDKEFRVPIRFDASQTTKVKAYFNNDNLDPQISCNKVFPVEREIPKTAAVARAALEELLAGVTFKEQNNGYQTSINPGVKIQSLTIDPPAGGGVARVDFDEQLEFQVGGSCRVSAIRAQITQTLLQFPTVKSVIISINGRTEDILQP
ncbi:MAG: GerMN domain-containing protein [bacterium]